MNHSITQPRGGTAVPFSWERRPGVSKVTRQEWPTEGNMVLKLPPPPCPTEAARDSVHDFQIPLPPCAFQPPSRSYSKKGLKHEDDPFLAAYKECTKSINGNGKSPKNSGNLYSRFRKISILDFSCRHSACSVRDDNLVKISRVPYERERMKY